MKQSSESNAFSLGAGSLFTLLLFLVFVLSSLFTILTGSQVYENIQSRDEEVFYQDTSMAYIRNKVRQADGAGLISVQDMDGISVLQLKLKTEPGQTSYSTLIYCQDGQLKELFTSEDSGLSLDAGMDIMECGGMSFQILENEDSQGLSRQLEIRPAQGAPARIRLMSQEESL